MDVLNFTRPGPGNRSGEAKHGILFPQRGLLRPSEVRSLNNIHTPYQTAPGGIGNITAGTLGVRSRPCVSTRVVDAALGIY